jgi:hypothetical protein
LRRRAKSVDARPLLLLFLSVFLPCLVADALFRRAFCHFFSQFSTRLGNLMAIGEGGKNKAWISLPKGKGVKLTITEERDRRFEAAAKAK